MGGNITKAEIPAVQLSQIDIHGLIYVTEKKHLLWRLFWGCLIVSFIGFAAFLCYNTSIEYVQNPKATLIDFQHVTQLEFPKVTICSYFPDAISPERISSEFFLNSSKEHNETLKNLVAYTLAGFGFHQFGRFVRDLKRHPDLLVQVRQLHKQLASGYKDQREFMEAFFQNYGYSCHDVLTGCSVNSKAFNCCDYFTTSYHGFRGKCLVSKNNSLFQQAPHNWGRLRLYLKFPQVLLNKQSEQQIAVHLTPRESDNPYDNNYFFLGMDTWNYFRIQKTIKIELLPDEFCAEQQLLYSSDYSMSLCNTEKVLQIPVKLIDCNFPFVPLDNQLDKTPYCQSEKLFENYESAVEKSIELSLHSEFPICSNPCSHWVYQVNHENEQSLVPLRNLYPEDPHDSVVTLMHGELEYEIRKEISTISWAGFVSQIGGNLGLALGCSLMTFFQVFIYLILKLGGKVMPSRSTV